MNDTNGKEQGEKSHDIILTPLGSGGWMPAKNRQTASYLFQKENTVIIMDFGTGIARLLDQFDFLLNGVEKVYGFISHYHPDHTIGLFYLPAVLKSRKLELYAPGKGIYDNSAQEILENFYTTPLLPRKLSESLPGSEIRDIPLDGMEINGIKISFRAQKRHVHPSIAIRLGNHCVYCTDTEPEYETIGFAMGASILLHECWFEDELPKSDVSSAQAKDLIKMGGKNGHSSNLAVALIGRESRVSSVYTIHHNPEMSEPEVTRIAREAAFISTVEMRPCEDGVTIQC